jgi:Methyltransferase FkbM domain
VPDDLEGIEACFSPGVGGSIGFETELLRRGIPSHLADASVARPPDLPPELTFDSVHLSSRTADRLMTLDGWIRRHRPEIRGDLMLQMDVEGAEYVVLPSVDPRTLARFRIIVVEFHRLPLMADPFLFRLMSPAIEVLLDQFAPVHLHPNNNRAPVRAATRNGTRTSSSPSRR